MRWSRVPTCIDSEHAAWRYVMDRNSLERACPTTRACRFVDRISDTIFTVCYEMLAVPVCRLRLTARIAYAAVGNDVVAVLILE